MRNKGDNFAYIDGANLHRGVRKTLMVASGGDYAALVKFLQERQKLLSILSPSNEKKCSILLKRTGAKISYINDQRSHLELAQKEKAPDRDGTL